MQAGSKTRDNKSKHHRWRTNLLLAITISGLAGSLATVWITQNYLWRIPVTVNSSTPRALIADQLALNYPDPGFVTNLIDALVGAGYHVDYWGPSPTAVDQFRQLPDDGYDLIIIRSHIGSSQAIITTQEYSRDQYSAEQVSGALVPAVVGNGPLYFALTAQFIRQDMTGRFPQSTVIGMGCSDLQGTNELATSFLDKGANYFVGWNGPVSMIHTDTSTVALVQQLSQGRSVPEAIGTAGQADPFFGARLGYLDWKTLVQARINDLASKLMVWVSLAAVLVLGPTTVFAGPKLFDLLDRTMQGARHRKKATRNHK